MRLFLAALALACASCSAPAAQTPPPTASAPRCVPVAMLQAMAVGQHVAIAEVRPVGPFLSALNAMPPRSDLKADQVFVMRAGNAARLLLAQHGCLSEAVQIGWDDFLRLAGEGA